MGYPLFHAEDSRDQAAVRARALGAQALPSASVGPQSAPSSGPRRRDAEFARQPRHFSYNRPVHAPQDQDFVSVGHYRLFAEIAAGGMATVHLGHHLGQTRTPGVSLHPYSNVAIKRLHAQYTRDEEFVTMFADEARLVAHIRHPNVVQTLDVVHDRGELSLVMEYVHGESFSKLLGAAYRMGQPAPPSIIRTVMVDVLRGLHGAHEATDEQGHLLQIVHRDVSPQNIIVGADGIARVLDFGIAKAIGRASVTRDNEVRGKIAYMAPEQLHRAGLDRRTDVYAASIILWESLTCKRLFHSSNEAATMARVMSLDVAPPSSHRDGVSAQMDAVVLRGLSRDPAQRFQSAWDMAQALAASGRCASRDELAEWVQTVAAEKLQERASLVALMQAQIPFSPEPAPHEVTGVRKTYPNANHLAAAAFTPAPQSQPPAPFQRETRKRHRLLMAAGTLVLSVATGVALSAFLPDAPAVQPSPSVAASPIVNEVAGPALSSNPAPPADVRPSTADGVEEASATRQDGTPPHAGERSAPQQPGADQHVAPARVTAPSNRAAPASAARNQAADEGHSATPTQPRHASRSASSPAGQKASASADCDPPFTIDESGTRRYKMACL